MFVTGPQYRKTDLLDLTGISDATFDRWRHHRLIPDPVGYGRWAYWTKDHLTRIRDIIAIRSANMTLADIYDRLHPAPDHGDDG